MTDVFVIGTGQTPVTRSSDRSSAQLGCDAIERAILDAGVELPDVAALYLGNMAAGTLEKQQQLASLCAHKCGLTGVEAFAIEASCASGAAALRTGFMAVAGGFFDVVAVCGTERLSHVPRARATRALATAAAPEDLGQYGGSFVGLNANLMRRYVEAHALNRDDLAGFAIVAHENGLNNPNALLQTPLDLHGYLSSRMLQDPLRLMDSPPICDGAAALILASGRFVRRRSSAGRPDVLIRASAIASDSLSASRCMSNLELRAVARSSLEAYRQAGMEPQSVDLFELHDAFTVITALSLESSGFVEPGDAVRLAREGELCRCGRLPISTMGGLKSRGHPVGATGTYQVVEAVRQLQGRVGANQIENARVAMTQNIGGMGATAITHILGVV